MVPETARPPRVAAIVGPTAVGKTELSLDVAARLEAEIVSIDSMQAYTGMDIGTAKATPEQRSRIPHHMLDLWPPDHDLTVSEFQNEARAVIDDIVARGHLPLLVGGSGLYFRAVVDDLEFPARSVEVRAALEAESEEIGAEALYRRLEQLDPKAATRIEPSNLRRTIRALEVIAITGEPFSSNDSWDRYESRYDLRVVGLTAPRDFVFQRIEERVDRMLAEGLIDEARRLGPAMARTARQGLGYRQVLDRSEASIDEIRAEIVRATKRFARRQESWFKSDPRVRWFDARGTTVADDVGAYLVSEDLVELAPDSAV